MICSILIFRNKAIGAYTTPQYDDHSPEVVAEQFGRSLKLNVTESNKFKNMALYYFGTFDDKSGVFNLLDKPQLLVDCDDFISQEVKENA